MTTAPMFAAYYEVAERQQQELADFVATQVRRVHQQRMLVTVARQPEGPVVVSSAPYLAVVTDSDGLPSGAFIYDHPQFPNQDVIAPFPIGEGLIYASLGPQNARDLLAADPDVQIWHFEAFDLLLALMVRQQRERAAVAATC